jgi:hypothetical protein
MGAPSFGVYLRKIAYGGINPIHFFPLKYSQVQFVKSNVRGLLEQVILYHLDLRP